MSCELYWFLFIKHFKTLLFTGTLFTMPFENFLKDFQSYPSIFPCIQFLHNIWPFNIYFFLLGVSEPLYWDIQPGSLPLHPILKAEPETRTWFWKEIPRKRLERLRQGRGRTDRDHCSGHWGFIPFWESYRMSPIFVFLKNGGLEHLSAAPISSSWGLP